MWSGVRRNAIGATILMVLAAGSAAAEDPGILATYGYPLETVQKATVDALTDIGCKIEKNEAGYIVGVRPHQIHMISAGSGGERVSVTLTAGSAGSTSVDIRTKKSFFGYVEQRNWDQTVREGIRQHVLAPAPRRQPPPSAIVAPQPKKEAPQQSSWVLAQSQSSASNGHSVDGAAIAEGLAVIAVVAADIFAASKGYEVAPAPVIVATPSSAPAVSQSPFMCPDGSFVSSPPCMRCPDGRYVGGSSTCSPTRIAPDGTLHSSGSPLRLCPDGSYVNGTACIPTPNGHYVGN